MQKMKQEMLPWLNWLPIYLRLNEIMMGPMHLYLQTLQICMKEEFIS